MNKEVTSYLFSDYLIIAFAKDWLNAFDGLPKFTVFIGGDKKLHLVSTQEVKK